MRTSKCSFGHVSLHPPQRPGGGPEAPVEGGTHEYYTLILKDTRTRAIADSPERRSPSPPRSTWNRRPQRRPRTPP